MTRFVTMFLAMALIVSVVAGCNKAPTPEETNYSLTTSVQGNGTIVANPEPGPYADGAMVEVLAKPKPGWRFNHWEGDLDGNVNPSIVKMEKDKAVKAVFVRKTVVEPEGENTEGETVEGETTEGEIPQPATVSISQTSNGFTAIFKPGDATTSELWSGASAMTTITKIVALNSNGDIIAEQSFSDVWPVVLTFSNTDRGKIIGIDSDGLPHGWNVE